MLLWSGQASASGVRIDAKTLGSNMMRRGSLGRYVVGGELWRVIRVMSRRAMLCRAMLWSVMLWIEMFLVIASSLKLDYTDHSCSYWAHLYIRTNSISEHTRCPAFTPPTTSSCSTLTNANTQVKHGMPRVCHVAQPICLELALLNTPYFTSGERGECPVKTLLEKHYQVTPDH